MIKAHPLRQLLLTACGSVCLLAPALANPLPGDACVSAGATTRSAGPSSGGAGHLLVCHGGSWKRVYSHTATGLLLPGMVNEADCADGDVLTYDAATGGIVCGVLDTFPPFWVTPSAVLDSVAPGGSVSEVVAAIDDVGTPTYSKSAGYGWLSAAADGTITGTAPEIGGVYYITVRATDGATNTVDRVFYFAVSDASGPAGCVNPGDVCADGTIYVGVTPDGGVDFFTPQATAATLLPFNDGSEDYVDTPLENCTASQATCTTGAANTADLAGYDASSAPGDQPHQAALWCHCLGEEHADASNGVVPAECAGTDAAAAEGHGHDDWYLPALAEMDVLYTNLRCPSDTNNPITPPYSNAEGNGGCSPADGPQSGLLGSSNHVTSTELNVDRFWLVNNSGAALNHNLWKSLTHAVRCVRK